MPDNLQIPVLKVKQWLTEWDQVKFSVHSDEYRKKPNDYFYVFSIKAVHLKRLSKIYRRTEENRRDSDMNIQRRHDESRSSEIARFLKVGFPLSEILNFSEDEAQQGYRMPGWLPTSIVANILPPEGKRNGKTINNQDVVIIQENGNEISLKLPSFVEENTWKPVVAPIEIIDGQHRLLSFDETDETLANYELPVVAFFDLDIVWQAYLFYTINVKPKRINKSLAYDLYPLLRTAEWLEGSMREKSIYKEYRAQEIVEILWAYKKGAWYKQINMLGDSGRDANITQASFVRNLSATFFKSKGLFIQKMSDDGTPLAWDRPQQAAFIIFIWEVLFSSIKLSSPLWFQALKTSVSPLFGESESESDLKLIVFNKYCLLTTDQGVRGFLQVMNDLLIEGFVDLGLRQIFADSFMKHSEDKVDLEDVSEAIEELTSKDLLVDFLKRVCAILSDFEWRTSSFPELSEEIQNNQRLFKGSGGYKDLRKQLLKKITESDDVELKNRANTIFRELGYASTSN